MDNNGPFAGAVHTAINGRHCVRTRTAIRADAFVYVNIGLDLIQSFVNLSNILILCEAMIDQLHSIISKNCSRLKWIGSATASFGYLGLALYVIFCSSIVSRPDRDDLLNTFVPSRNEEFWLRHTARERLQLKLIDGRIHNFNCSGWTEDRDIFFFIYRLHKLPRCHMDDVSP